MFANDYNCKLPVYCSRFWDIRSSAVDAFSLQWSGFNGWYVPPVCLVSKVLQYMQQCKAYGTVIVPLWRSASFWPLLCPSGKDFIPNVVSYVYLPTEKSFYTPGKSKTFVFGNIDLPFSMLALKLHFDY